MTFPTEPSERRKYLAFALVLVIVVASVGLVSFYYHQPGLQTSETTPESGTCSTPMVAGTTTLATTTTFSGSITAIPPQVIEIVNSSFEDHLLSVGSRNVTALLSEYEHNATIDWTGEAAGLLNSPNGPAAITYQWKFFFSAMTQFVIGNETQTILPTWNGSVVMVDSTFDFAGYSNAHGEFSGTVHAQDSYASPTTGGPWLIAQETWDFIHYVVQYPIGEGFPPSQPPSIFAVDSMSISSDGNYAAAGTSDSVDSSPRNGSVYLVSLEDQGTVWRYITNDTAISSVAISSNGSYVVAGGGAEVYLFNAEGRLLWTVPTGASVIQVAIAANGSRIAADYGGGIVYLNGAGDVLWNRTFPQGSSSSSFAMSSDGKFVAYGQSEFPTGNETEGSGWGVFYLDSQGHQLWNYTEDDGAVGSVQMSSDGSYVATGSLYSAYNGSAYYFDGSSGALLWKQPALAAVEFLVMSSDGSHIALGGNAGLLLFDSSGTLLYHNATLAPVPVAVSYCDSAVLLSGEDGQAQLMGYNGTILATSEVEGLSADAVFPNGPGWAAVGGSITGAGDCAMLHVFDDLSEISSVMLC